MKKVIILNHGLHICGVSRTLVNFANNLVKNGYDVTIKLEINDLTLASELDERVKCSLFLKEPYIFGLRVRGFLKFYYSLLKLLYKLPRRWQYKLVVGKGYDIEIGFNRGAAARIISASTNRAATKLTWVHNDYMKNSNPVAGFENVTDASNAYSKFDNVVCVSSQAEQSFIRKFGDTGNTVTRFNIMDVSRIERLSDEKITTNKNKFTILSVGRLCEGKNYSALLKVAKLLEEKIPNQIDYWIIGDGELSAELEKEKEELKLKNVHFLGAKENPYPYFKNADLYLCTSIYEGLSTTVIEALISGLPIITTDCTGMRDILGDSEYGIIVPIDIQQIADAVYSLFSQQKTLQHYKEKSSIRAKDFNPKKCFSAIQELF